MKTNDDKKPSYPPGHQLNPRHQAQVWTNDDTRNHPTVVKDWGPSKTKQSEVDTCDINNIIDRYGIEDLPGVDREQLYADFSDSASFHEAQEIISNARQQFAALPAKVRERFMNDPSRMLAFVEEAHSSADSADEMVKLGLATKMPTPPAAPPEAKTKQPASSAASKPKKDSSSTDDE